MTSEIRQISGRLAAIFPAIAAHGNEIPSAAKYVNSQIADCPP
jgi:hypothetical protein